MAKRLYVKNVALMSIGTNVGTVKRDTVTTIAEKILVVAVIHSLMYPVTSVMVKAVGGSAIPVNPPLNPHL